MLTPKLCWKRFSAQTQSRVLLPAFVRGLRDPFVPCRVKALAGIAVAAEAHDPKVSPTACKRLFSLGCVAHTKAVFAQFKDPFGDPALGWVNANGIETVCNWAIRMGGLGEHDRL